MTYTNDGGRQTPPVHLELLTEYNYDHFRTKHFLADIQRTVRGEGVPPRQAAPDFELQSTEGQPVRLSELRGKPVLLHFGSFT